MISWWERFKSKHLYIFIWKNEIKKEQKAESLGNEKKYLAKWYKRSTGKALNIDCPKTFTEKQQWIKLYDQNKLKTYCTDKFLVRKYISKKIGEQYLIPIIKIGDKECFDNAFEIHFEDLPKSFVIQCNHGAHMTHIVKDKYALGMRGFRRLQRKLNKELKINYAYCHGYEMQYKDIKPCIFITEYVENNGDLPDYKFFYFHGKMEFFSVDENRFSAAHSRTIYNSNFEKAYFQCKQYPLNSTNVDIGECNQMIQVADILAKDFEVVRIDLYWCNKKVMFGELTFSSAAGIAILDPVDADEKMGAFIDLTKIKEKIHEDSD